MIVADPFHTVVDQLVPFSDQDGSAGLMLMDPSIPEFMSTKSPRKLVKNDGSIVTEIVHSAAVPELDQPPSAGLPASSGM